MKISLAALATLACSVFAGTSSAIALTNGSFEDTTGFVDNTGQDTMVLGLGSTVMTGWTVNGAHSIAWIGPTNPFGATAENGSYFLDLTGYIDGSPYGGVQQALTTTAGHNYQVTFYLGSSSNYGIQNALTASAGGASQTFSSTNPGSNPNYWEFETFNFTAISSSTTLSLVGGNGYAYIGLDNVAVTDLSGSVPEPSTWALMLLGFVGLGYGRYRKNRGERSVIAAS